MRKTFRQQFSKIYHLAARSHSKKNGTPRVYVQSNIIRGSFPSALYFFRRSCLRMSETITP